MLEKKDVEKLAKLSRIDVSEDEKEVLLKDLEEILVYVSEVQEVVVGDTKPDLFVQEGISAIHNIMREDENPHKSGEFSKEIMKEAPSTKDNYIKVKKIL